MISIQNVTKNFENKIAIQHLSIDLPLGIVGLVGQNGAGKSTLLRLISDVIYPSEGTIEIDGIPNMQEEAKGKVFFLADDPYYPKTATPLDLYNFVTAAYTVDKEKYLHLLETFGLPQKKRIATFSKGMKRQTFLALSLSIQCDYLLLDEAFDGLDPLMMERLRHEIEAELPNRKSIVLSSHNLIDLQKIAEHFIVITNGVLSGNNDKTTMSSEYCQYQFLPKNPVSVEEVQDLSPYILRVMKQGSIIKVILNNPEGFEEMVKSRYEVLLLEKIPVESWEIMKTQMEQAEKGGDHE